MPALLYNVSIFTGVNLLPDAAERLAPHPNIIWMKIVDRRSRAACRNDCANT